jgi:hypothetical protein
MDCAFVGLVVILNTATLQKKNAGKL